MRVFINALRSLLLLLVLGSCSETQTKTMLFSADCNSQPLQLHLVHTKSLERQYYTHELSYNGKVISVIDAVQSGHTLPYELTVYGKALWHLLDTTRQLYRPSGDTDSVPKTPVMLYMDVAAWTPREFEQVYDCMKQQHKAMQQKITQKGGFHPYQFGGIVYGSRGSFAQRYEKNEDNFFTIYPDGQIIHTDSESFGTTITSSNGLSPNVLMPGKRILINTAQLSMNALPEYRNHKTNHSLNMDFHFQIDSAFHSR